MKLLPDGHALGPQMSHTPVIVYKIPSDVVDVTLNTDEYSMEKLANGYFATSGSDMKIKFWDLSTGNMVNSFQTNENQFALKQTVIYNYLASGGESGNIYIWNLDNGALIRTLVGHTKCIFLLRLSGSGKLISGANDGSIRIWDIQTGACFDKTNVFGHALLTFLMLTGDTLLAGSYSSTFYILKINQNNQFNQVGSVTVPGSRVNDFALTNSDILLVAVDGGNLLYYNKTNFQYLGNTTFWSDILSIETSRNWFYLIFYLILFV